MTHTFKLARRMARLRPMAAAATVAVAATTGCTEEPTDPTSATQVDSEYLSQSPGKQVVAVELSPDTISLVPGATKAFSAQVRLRNGSTSTQPVTYTSTGGATDSAGTYTAGEVAGTYTVVARLESSGLADTAAVTITEAASSCVSTATMLCPGDNIQAKVNAAAVGTRFTLATGIHRLQTIIPKSGQSFVGQAGAILSGARLLTGWVRSSSGWYVTAQTQEYDHSSIPSLDSARCDANAPCQYAQDVYRDNVLLTRVTSLSALGPGKFYFDYGADRIYVGDDPSGHKIEGAVTPVAFEGTSQGAGSGVTIQGLVIEKYATPSQLATVGRTGAGANWVVRDNEIRYNHATGLHTGSAMQILNNNIHHNGQMGVGGGGDNLLLSGNTIAYNNTARYDYGWEAGGTKFISTRNMQARGNFSHHNRGPGLWWDGNNDGALIESNRVEDNVADGIFWEISYAAVIRNNTLSRNGFGRIYGSEGAGILINTSGPPSGVLDIYGNTLVGNKEGIMALMANRGSGSRGVWQVQNLSVHDNTVELIAGGNMGIDRYSGTTAIWSSLNNHFERNTYQLRAAPAAPFIWNQAYQTDARWRALGNDDTGVFNR
jgi:parallel beta-helix repeat protein